jgi:transcriptional regulator with XRE-family HTH domain
MTDVVGLAKARRADLVSEIARIDDFIRMAEVLMKYSDRLGCDPVAGTNGSVPATHLADRGDDGNFIGDEVKAGDGLAMMTTTLKEVVTVKCDISNIFPDSTLTHDAALTEALTSTIDRTPIDTDHFAFDQQPSVSEDELVLINPLSGDPGPVDVHIGQRLRQRRWMMGVSQQQLGDSIGVRFDQIQKYEAGTARISVRCMWDIAAAMEVPVSHFFEGLEGQAVDTGEAGGDILTDEEALELAGAAPSARRA